MNHIAPHFSITMSANKMMEDQLETFIRSVIKNGKTDAFYTIFIQNGEKVHNKFLKDNCEIVGYSASPEFSVPWTSCPRWRLEPKSDLCVGVDSDVFVCRSIEEYIAFCSSIKGISGVLCSENPLSITEWKRLFEDAKIDFASDLFVNQKNQQMPYYINNGVVALTKESIPAIREFLPQALSIVNKRHRGLFYITQVAHTLAIYMAKIDKQVLPHWYNQTGFYGGITDKTVFYHYNLNKKWYENHLQTKKTML